MESDIRIDLKKNSSTGRYILKAQGHIDHAPIDVWRLLVHGEMRKEWDSFSDEHFFTKKYGANLYGVYSRSKQILVVSGRDFVLNFMFNKDKDGTITIVATDTFDQEILTRCP